MRRCSGSAASSEPAGAAAASGVVRPTVGPKGFSASEVDLDVRVGGRYRIEMQPLEGNGFFVLRDFRQVDPPTRLAYTFPRAARPGGSRGSPGRDEPGRLSVTACGFAGRVHVVHGSVVLGGRRDVDPDPGRLARSTLSPSRSRRQDSVRRVGLCDIRIASGRRNGCLLEPPAVRDIPS